MLPLKEFRKSKIVTEVRKTQKGEKQKNSHIFTKVFVFWNTVRENCCRDVKCVKVLRLDLYKFLKNFTKDDIFISTLPPPFPRSIDKIDRVIEPWNLVPSELKNARTVSFFKRAYKQEAQNGNGGNPPIRTRDRIQPEARPTSGTGYLLRDSTWIIGGQLTRNKINYCKSIDSLPVPG